MKWCVMFTKFLQCPPHVYRLSYKFENYSDRLLLIKT